MTGRTGAVQARLALRTLGGVLVHAVEPQHVEVNIQVQRAAEALDQGHRTALRRIPRHAGLIGKPTGDQLALTLLTGNAGSLSTAFATVVQRGYSRQAETLADGHAIAAVKKLYGHAGGGASVFETFAAYHTEHGGEAPSLLSTHPLDAERIERLRQAAADWDPVRQPLRPLALPMPPPQ